MTFKQIVAVAAIGISISGCAMTSDVMNTGNGTYMISAHAAPIRGGTEGANEVAYKDANAFCAKQGKHAVVLAANSRDTYQGSWGANGGGVFAAGNTDFHFRCDGEVTPPS